MIDFDIISEYLCLEPKVGKQLLPLYPEWLSQEERAQFEAHRESCDYCQEVWKLWRATALNLRINSFLNAAQEHLNQREYDEAIALYNSALEIEPDLLSTGTGQAFFLSDARLPLTAAASMSHGEVAEDILSFVSFSSSGIVEMAAAKLPEFPIVLEYANGAVSAKISTMGSSVFFHLLKVPEGMTMFRLFGVVEMPTRHLTCWDIAPNVRCKLGTIPSLFGQDETAAILRGLRTFELFPLYENLRQERA